MSEKKYTLLPANDAVQNWFEENIDKECSASSAIYKFRLWLESLQRMPQPRPGWVKAKGGMPEGIYSMKLVSNDIEMRGTGLVNHGVIQLITFLNKSTMGIDDLPKDYEGVYYLDESGTALESTAEQPVAIPVEPDFLTFVQNERGAITKEMLSDEWWLTIPAAKRVKFENVLIAYDQMAERLAELAEQPGREVEAVRWIKSALEWAKETIEFASDKMQCPEPWVETWGNHYMNAMHAIQEAQREIDPNSEAVIATQEAFLEGQSKKGNKEREELIKQMVDIVRVVSESGCDYESVNFAKNLHDPECRACKATEALNEWNNQQNRNNG